MPTGLTGLTGLPLSGRMDREPPKFLQRHVDARLGIGRMVPPLDISATMPTNNNHSTQSMPTPRTPQRLIQFSSHRNSPRGIRKASPRYTDRGGGLGTPRGFHRRPLQQLTDERDALNAKLELVNKVKASPPVLALTGHTAGDATRAKVPRTTRHRCTHRHRPVAK